MSCDILVAGGGIVGLWLARLAGRAGQSVVLLEAGRLGDGASGGLLGALMPHMPENWNAKKQFQFEALVSLQDRVRELQEETGLDCGYRRCGRLLPLTSPRQVDLARVRVSGAARLWASADSSAFRWRVADSGPDENWPTAAAMPHGVVHETLAARIDPRRYLSAVAASLSESVTVIEGDGLRSVDPDTDTATTENGRSVRCGSVVLAAGHRSFELMGRWTKRQPVDYGMPVKGQAALLRADIDPALPVVFQDGVYVVPHEGGHVAVGSTTERQFESADGTDQRLDAVVAAASALCPALMGAPVVERWAGLRPRAVRPDPMIGAVPGFKRVFVATGGFKITFGVAHEMARGALNLALFGRDDRLPESFRLEHHLQPRA